MEEIDETMGKGKLIDEIFGEFCEGTYIQPTFITDYPVDVYKRQVYGNVLRPALECLFAECPAVEAHIVEICPRIIDDVKAVGTCLLYTSLSDARKIVFVPQFTDSYPARAEAPA